MVKHAKSCWGDEAWIAANECQNASEAREKVTSPIAKSGSIMAVFNRVKGKGKITYSHRMHTKMETKCITWYSSLDITNEYLPGPKLFIGCLRVSVPSRSWRTEDFSH